LTQYNRVPQTAWMILALLSTGPVSLAAPAPQPQPTELAPPVVEPDMLRRFYLTDIHQLRDYRAGKNSFVEGPDRRWGSYQAAGQRLTLLDVAGPGCLCHLWSTWRPGAGDHRLEFYLDRATTPQISATLDELIAAAQQMPTPPVPVPAFIGSKGARNVFLPIAFQRGLRIEMETIEPTSLIFWQIDYRLGDQGLPGKLHAQRVDGRLALRWEGPPGPAAAAAPRVTRQSAVTIPAGESRSVAEWSGPAIVRQWSLQTDGPAAEHDQLDLEIRYDDAPRPAVRATLADFFGPFHGVALDSDLPAGRRTCWLPMPLRRQATLALRNRLARPVTVRMSCEVEPAAAWDERWGYFHAVQRQTASTTGYRQHEVLALRGRGHWLGMTLYATGHDHGGGDFAVIDGASDHPAFLHGINGEDYFTFAWFGRGAHLPYAVAGSNDAGRRRLHFENPYPFHESLNIYWGAYPKLTPRSVAYWYQDAPDDTTLSTADQADSGVWDCFGPVPLPLNAQHRPAGDPFAVLPSVADLDAGKQFPCRCIQEQFTAGWMKQQSFGPMLDLTYLARHGTVIKGEIELGGMGHALLARRKLSSSAARKATLVLSHDDPLRVLVNGREVYRGESHLGFATRQFPVELRAGENEIVVQLTNFFNVNFNWAGFALSVR